MNRISRGEIFGYLLLLVIGIFCLAALWPTIIGTSVVRPNIVMLVVDASGSMAGDKLQEAGKGGLDLAEKAFADGYRVGLVAFDSDARLLTSPVLDMKEIRAAVEQLRAGGTTNLAAGITLATKHIGEERGAKHIGEERGANDVICIVTDGQPDDAELVIRAAEVAKEKQIDIMAIGTDDADQDFLDRLATREELAHKVERRQLRQGISDMARLLPKRDKQNGSAHGWLP